MKKNEIRYSLSTKSFFSLKRLLLMVFLTVGVSCFNSAKGIDKGAIANSQQQQQKVTGVVTDDQGNPIPGATVLQKGSTNGTITDNNGNYSISVASSANVLVFSFVGMQTQEIKINRKSKINVTLSSDNIDLDEVVVVGYGTVKKSDLTGSVSNLKPEAFEDQPISSFDEALQGRLAGVHITNTGGPGGTIDVKIRGASSINAGVSPLYVIDGIPIDMDNIGENNSTLDVGGELNVMSSINPDDIKSIEVLKDASATAIYGSRGSNGVILITTNSGSKGKRKLSINYTTTIRQMEKKLDLMNATEFSSMAEAAEKYFNNEYNLYPYGEGFDTDWQDEMTRVSNSHNLNVGMSGGSESMLYNISANYLDNQGIIRNSFMKRFSTRFNLDFIISDRLKFGTRVSASKQMSEFSSASNHGANFRYVLEAAPTLPIKDENGSYTSTASIVGGNTFNPVAVVEKIQQSNPTYRMLLNTFGEYKLADWLTYKVTVGYDILNSARKIYQPTDVLYGINNVGFGNIKNEERNNWIITNQLNFQKQFNKNHSLNGVIAYEASENKIENSSLTGTDFFTNSFGYHNLAVAEVQEIATGQYKSSMLSYLGRLNYTLLNQFLFTGSVRYDGSSKFGSGNKWGMFPSGAFAWKANKMRFIKDLDIFDELKFRASYGETGNQRIGIYQSLSSAEIVQYGVNSIVNGLNITRLGNSDLMWETSKQMDIGVDVAFFKNRFQFTADYYKKETTDMLLKLAIPAISGFDKLLSNRGGMEVEGLEFAVRTRNLTKKLKWDTNFNISFDRGKITNLADEPPIMIVGAWNIAGGTTTSDLLGLITEGDRLNNFWGYVADGTIQMGDTEKLENRHLEKLGKNPGDVRFVDVNNDGKLDNADLGIIGNASPDFYFGLTNEFRYKNFSLNCFVQGSYGNDIMNMLNKRIRHGFSPSSGKLNEIWDNRWDANMNPTNEYTGFNYDSRISTMYREDASYIRLKSLTLSYSMPKNFIKGVNNLKIFASGTNLYTFTNYSGYDPAYGNSDNLIKGFDSGWYPLEKGISFGIKLQL